MWPLRPLYEIIVIARGLPQRGWWQMNSVMFADSAVTAEEGWG